LPVADSSAAGGALCFFREEKNGLRGAGKFPHVTAKISARQEICFRTSGNLFPHVGKFCSARQDFFHPETRLKNQAFYS